MRGRKPDEHDSDFNRARPVFRAGNRIGVDKVPGAEDAEKSFFSFSNNTTRIRRMNRTFIFAVILHCTFTERSTSTAGSRGDGR